MKTCLLVDPGWRDGIIDTLRHWWWSSQAYASWIEFISMDSWSTWWWSWWRCPGGWLWWGKWGWWWCWWWEEEDSIVGNLPVMGWVSTNTANFLSPFLHRAFPLKTKTTNTKTSTKPNIDKNWRSWVESVQIQLTASTFYKVLSCLN